MAKRKKKTSIPAKRSKSDNYDGMLGEITDLLEYARRTSVRTVNAILTLTYWEIGHQIVEFELGEKNGQTTEVTC